MDENKVVTLAQALFRTEFPRSRLPRLNSPVGEYYVRRARAKLASARKTVAPEPERPATL